MVWIGAKAPKTKSAIYYVSIVKAICQYLLFGTGNR